MGLPGAHSQTRRNELLQTFINLRTAVTENQHPDLFIQQKSTSDGICKVTRNFTEKACEFQACLPTEIDSTEKKDPNQVSKNSRQENRGGNMLTDFGIEINLEQPSSDCEDDLNSEDLNEYNVDDGDDDDDEDEPIYATLSSHSCCSATTAANDDFEFFQHEEKISELVDNVVEVTENSIIPQNTKKHFVCGPESGDGHSDQSLLCMYQREIFKKEDCAHQSYQCADWTVDKNSEVSKLALPLIQSYQNQNNNMKLSYRSDATCSGKKQPHCRTITHSASEILKTVIQNELMNNKCNAFMKGSGDDTSRGTGGEPRRRGYDSYSRTQSETNSKNLQFSCVQGLETEDQKESHSVRSRCENLNLRIPHVSNVTRKKRVKKQNLLAGSLSLNNLDELLLEEAQEDLVIRSKSSRTNPHEKMKNGSQNDSNSSDEREV
jgi:hypothetical protein